MVKKKIISKKSKRCLDFRLFLQNELVERCRKNNLYSLRSFAKSLEINHATLSHLIRGKRPITKKMQQKLGRKLGLCEKKMEEFRIYDGKKGDDQSNSDNFTQLAQDSLAVISDWYYGAIWELMKLDHFNANPRWIAKALGITTSEVNIALERFQRLRLMEIKSDGTWVINCEDVSGISNDESVKGLPDLQKKILQMAMEALINVPKTKRAQISMALSLDRKDFPEIRKRIKKFGRQLNAYTSRDGAAKNCLYQLTMACFPLTKDN